MQGPTFVTGATGFLGGHLTRALVARGGETRVLVRTPRRAFANGAKEVVGDVTADSASLVSAMKGCDVVYHCAGAVGDRVTWKTGRSVNAQGTRNVLSAAIEARVRRFVHVSSVAVYGFHAGTFPETAARRPSREPYIDTKIDAELACEDAAARGGIEVRILRPAIVYGPQDTGFLPRMLELLRRRTPMIGDGAARVGLVHVADVVCAMLAAAAHDGSSTIFNVAGSEDVTWNELVAKLVEGCDLPEPRRMPVAAASFLGGLMQTLSAVHLGPTPPPLTLHAVRFLTQNRTYPIDRLRDELGVTPRVSIAAGLEQVIAGMQRPTVEETAFGSA
jgi:nucleoside-diphosphate-sugar epimerase